MALIEGDDLKTPTHFAEIPWYRDIRVLRALAQIIFLILALLIGAFLINNLLTNLKNSNIGVNFGIYSAPFGVAVSEGPSVTSTWEWLQDRPLIERVTTFVYVAIFGSLLFSLWKKRSGLQTLFKGLSQLALSLFTAINPSNAVEQKINQYQASKQTQKKRTGPPVDEDGDYVTAVLLVMGLILMIVFINAFPPSRVPNELQRYFATSSMTRAFFTGIVNTIRVVFFSLFASTLLGVLVGVALLTKNLVLRSTANIYVEIFRNTPLAVQLLFIYRLLTLVLPRPQDSFMSSSTFPFIGGETELYALNTRGLYLVSPVVTSQTWLFLLCIAIAFVIAYVVRKRRLHHQDQTGEPARVFRYTAGIWVIGLAIGWIITGSWPLGGTGAFELSYPILEGRQIAGGSLMTIAFFSLFLGLTLYTGAFIAEIVRAGIQAVPYGQIEAARSQGLSGGLILNLIILPQALRLIIPPLGNQYVNLGKNSSLGIMVTYVDLYRVGVLANNESGQAVPFFTGMMILYLLISLVLSLLTNLVNRSSQFKTR
jgi:general L-amino acid transport system permease protein